MRRKKRTRAEPKKERLAGVFFPGSGAPPDRRISFPQHAVPLLEESDLRKATTEQLKEELRYQEGQLSSHRGVFPRVATGTRAELTHVEEQAASKMEAHQLWIDRLKLELISRGDNTGTPAVLAETEAVPEKAEEFNHSEDYRSIRWRGESYSLTSRQAQVVEMLWQAHHQGSLEVSKDYILEKLGSPSSRLRDSFRRSELWGHVIVPGSKRGTYRLNLSSVPKPRS